jgi:hypothetical protein
MFKQYPVIITVRDRLTCLKELLNWLETAGQTEIWLCDNASTYPPLVDFLRTTNHHVVYNNYNLGHRAPWLSGLVPELGDDRFFIISDPDVVPDKNTPNDVFEVFEEAFLMNPKIDKVGLYQLKFTFGSFDALSPIFEIRHGIPSNMSLVAQPAKLLSSLEVFSCS